MVPTAAIAVDKFAGLDRAPRARLSVDGWTRVARLQTGSGGATQGRWPRYPGSQAVSVGRGMTGTFRIQ